jgi:hypothetical protein
MNVLDDASEMDAKTTGMLCGKDVFSGRSVREQRAGGRRGGEGRILGKVQARSVDMIRLLSRVPSLSIRMARSILLASFTGSP